MTPEGLTKPENLPLLRGRSNSSWQVEKLVILNICKVRIDAVVSLKGAPATSSDY